MVKLIIAVVVGIAVVIEIRATRIARKYKIGNETTYQTMVRLEKEKKKNKKPIK